MARRRRMHGVIASIGLVLAILSKRYHGPIQGVIRGNLDDVFIVIAVYFAIRTVCSRIGPERALLTVLALAYAVELLQGVGILHPELAPIVAYWLGSSFDPLDLVAYLIGALICSALERVLQKLSSRARPP